MALGSAQTEHLKIREELASYDDDPGWYQYPPGTLALAASEDELRRNLGLVP